MNPQTIVIIIIAATVIAIIIVTSIFFSKKAIVKRKLKKTADKKISDFQSGDIAKVIGKVEFAGKPLKAPLSGRPCAYYYVLIEQKVSTGKSSHWKTIIEEETAGTFVIRDGRHCAYSNCEKIKSYIVQDRKFSSGFLNDATEELEKFLRDHGQESEGFFGFNKTLRYKEGVLEEGELIAVVGRGEWKNAIQVKLPDTYDRVLAISATEEEPVFLSDDPDTVKSTYEGYTG